jgi:hypothetical protein
MENMKIAENIANIGIMAGYLIAKGQIEVEDSVELSQTIIHLAHQFEEQLGEIAEKEENYIEYIDSFAKRELLKRYSMKNMDMRNLKMLITKTLKQNGFQKVKIVKSETVKGYHTVFSAGFDYYGDEIRWVSTKNSSKDEEKEQIQKIFHCLQKNGFSSHIEMDYVGLAKVPVIKLKL